MGVKEEDKKYYDAKSRDAEGPWRDNICHPLHTPTAKRQNIDPNWYTETWTQHEPCSSKDDAEKEKLLKPFKALQRNGDAWERMIYKCMDMKLSSVAHSCAAFGSKWKDGVKYEIESIRLIYDEKRYDVFSSVPLTHDAEDMVCFHGTQLKNVRGIVKDGFSTKASGCWYGNGAYFTNNIPYAQHYIGSQTSDGSGNYAPAPDRGKDPEWGIRLPALGHTVYVFGCLLRPGSVKVVPPDETPPGSGYVGPYRDKDKDKDFDSHVAWVTPQSGGLFGFRPMTQAQITSNPELLVIKEYVIFDGRRALPRFLVGLKRIS